MYTCQIQWIDAKGNPTPDCNPAIASAICYDPSVFGEAGSPSFLICEQHALLKSKFWKLIRLPEQAQSEQHRLVQLDSYFKIIPNVVSSSIKTAFPKDAKEILDSLRWNGDHWSFNRWGMYVGVEDRDGYIHT
jgi:hypothetical protein